MQHTHTHKAVTGSTEAKKLLSRRRQSNYTYFLSLHVKYAKRRKVRRAQLVKYTTYIWSYSIKNDVLWLNELYKGEVYVSYNMISNLLPNCKD